MKKISLIGTLLLLLLPKVSSSQIVIQPIQYINAGGQSIGPILIPDGSAAAPSLAFTSETNSGLYKIGTNDFGFAVAGTRYFEVYKFGGTSWFDLQSTGTLTWSGDVNLTRDGAPNILALKNSTNAQTFNIYTPGLDGNHSATGLHILNNTASTAGTPVQMSGPVFWTGTAYNSVSTLSETNSFFIENLPATNAGTITGTMKFGYIAPNGVVTYPMTLDSVGNISNAGGLLSQTYFEVANTGLIGTQSRGFFTFPADGQFVYKNNGNTAGFGIDGSTDGTMKIRTRAQNAYGTIDALGINASGVAGASCAVAIPAHITVVNGIVTVCN